MHVHPTSSRVLTLMIVLLTSSICIQHTFAQDTCQSLVANLQNEEAQLKAAQSELNEHTCTGTAKAQCIKLIKGPTMQISKLQNLLDEKCAPGSGTSYPRYSVITVLYALPGNSSEVKYENDLRVSASRSRCRNLVGLNGLARLRPLEFSGQAPGYEIRVRQRLALLAAQRAQTSARDPG